LAALAVSIVHSAPSVDQSLDDYETVTQFSLTTADDEETEVVSAKGLGIFSDYCISTRDYILTDMRKKGAVMSSQGFSSFFQMAEDVASHALSVNEDATSRLSKQLADPSAEVDGDDSVAEAQREISEQSQAMSLLTALKATLSTTMSAVQTVVEKKAKDIQSLVSFTNWIKLAESGCAQAELYEKELVSLFEKFKDEHLTNEELKSRFGGLNMDAIPCVTSSRIVRVNGICGFVHVSVEPLKKILAPYFNSQSIKDAVAERSS